MGLIWIEEIKSKPFITQSHKGTKKGNNLFFWLRALLSVALRLRVRMGLVFSFP
jgi:hypothetical protein